MIRLKRTPRMEKLKLNLYLDEDLSLCLGSQHTLTYIIPSAIKNLKVQGARSFHI